MCVRVFMHMCSYVCSYSHPPISFGNCTVIIMLTHEGYHNIKCGSTMCQNYNVTCDGSRILLKNKLRTKCILAVQVNDMV